MVTTILEYVGAISIVVGLACSVLVFAPYLWPLVFIIAGVGFIAVSAVFSKAESR